MVGRSLPANTHPTVIYKEHISAIITASLDLGIFIIHHPVGFLR
jgi:hypothetical protein